MIFKAGKNFLPAVLIFAFGSAVPVLSPQAALAEAPLTVSSAAVSPVFLSNLPNPNDYTLFANSGWDGSWHVGYNTCWIQKVTVPEGSFSRAFIGARLGRMKNFQPRGKAPWDRRAYPGSVYMAVASTPSWTRAQSFFLADTQDIPLESDPEVAYEGVTESRWFWVEVPLKLLRPGQDHYLALWSPTEKLIGISSCPVLAAAWGTRDVDSWVSNDIKGVPPKDPSKALSTPVTIFEPAIALKLIPAAAESAPKPRVRIGRIENGRPRGKMPAPKVVWSQAEGAAIEKGWIEFSTDTKHWTRYGRTQWTAPFVFTLRLEDIPIGSDGKTWVRAGAADALENQGVSEPVNLFEER